MRAVYYFLFFLMVIWSNIILCKQISSLKYEDSERVNWHDEETFYLFNESDTIYSV